MKRENKDNEKVRKQLREIMSTHLVEWGKLIW
jgi:hypothetical protein